MVGMTSDPWAEDTAAIEKAASGSKARVLQDVARYLGNPDALMVSERCHLANAEGMAIAPSKLFEDGGKRLDVIRYISKRAADVRFPLTPQDLFVSLEDFFTFCGLHEVPPTIGLFAVWNGVSVVRVNQIERDRTDARSDTISVCKEAIRGFLELAAMDSALNPIIYFHMNKVYYGAVENQQVTHVIEDNTKELSPDEQRERVILLQQDSDGVYRSPDE